MGQRSDERFQRSLERGRLGELLTVSWLQSRGCGVVPCYDFCGSNGEKAPRLQFKDNGLVIPDLDVCSNGKRWWLEVKTYRAPAWNARNRCLVHGITSRLRKQYDLVSVATGTDVLIAVLEVESGVLLAAQLGLLEDWPCMCAGCRAGKECTIGWRGIKAGSYWPRASMAERVRFDDAQMAPIRSAWTEAAA
jgi:hypothetical protein